MTRPNAKNPIRPALILLAFLSACAPHKPTQSGFLADYAQVNVAAPVAARYTSALIDPVEFRPVGRLPKTVDPAVVADLTTAYRQELQTAFATRYSLVTRPGRDTLRVRAAITGFTLANPALNAAAIVSPIPLPSGNGGVSTEAEVVDARTGTRFATQSKGFNGNIFNSGPAAAFKREAHARAGFRKLAVALLAEVAPPAQ